MNEQMHESSRKELMKYIVHSVGKYLFKVNNKDTKTTSIEVVLKSLMLTLMRYFTKFFFYSLFYVDIKKITIVY